jgi:rhodanese-related sulfurtransferase
VGDLRRVSPAQAHALLREQGYVYLDVRTVEEFDLGHPEGAYNVPLSLSTAKGLAANPDFLAVVQGGFASDQGIVVGCRTGSVSLGVLQLLAQAGYSRVVEQRAGFEGARDAFGQRLEPGWQAAGLPCSTVALPGHDYAALLAHKA